MLPSGSFGLILAALAISKAFCPGVLPSPSSSQTPWAIPISVPTLCCDMLEPTLMPWPANACKY